MFMHNFQYSISISHIEKGILPHFLMQSVYLVLFPVYTGKDQMAIHWLEKLTHLKASLKSQTFSRKMKVPMNVLQEMFGEGMWQKGNCLYMVSKTELLIDAMLGNITYMPYSKLVPYGKGLKCKSIFMFHLLLK